MKPRQATMKEVAKEAGVSVATVSRALNGLSGLSEETREHVLEVCERLAYVPNTLARGLVMQHTQTIGLVVPDITSPFYSKLMVLAASEAKLLGYQVLLCSSFRNYEMEMDYFKLLIGNQVEGILFFPVGEESADKLYHFLRYVPIVSLNQMPQGSPIPYVCADEAEGGRIATEHLLECGCEKLLFVGYEERRLAHRLRAESFHQVMNQRNRYGEVFESARRYKSSFERGYQQFLEFWREKPFRPDGVIAASDATANGVIKACVECGIPVPEELSLIGFDNINVDLPTIELTTVSVSHSLHVKRAIELLNAMGNGKTLKPEEKQLFLKPDLIKRDSCRERNA